MLRPEVIVAVIHEYSVYKCYLFIKQICISFFFINKLSCHFLQGATLVDQVVKITPAENYVPKPELQVYLSQITLSFSPINAHI